MAPRDDELIDYALACLANGWVAVPRRGKRPLVRDWTTLRAADLGEDDIRGMPWDGADGAFLVMAVGALALDVDDLELFLARGHRVPRGPGQDTPSGGLHRLLRGDVPQVGLKTTEGYDTRAGGRGGIAVYDLSMVPPRVADLPVAPAWLGEVERPQSTAAEDEDAVWPQGERDERLFRYLCRLRNAGLDRDGLLAEGKRKNNEACDPPLPPQDVKRIAGQAAKYEVGDAPIVITLRSGGQAKPAALSSPLVVVGARELLAKELKPRREPVPDIVVAGLGLLAAKPKIGKSWLIYQAAVAIATGGEILGRRALKGDVLYLALEDGELRAQSRIRMILDRLGTTRWPSDAAALDVAFNAGRGDPLVEQVEEWLAARDDPMAVFVDVLQKIRPASTGRRGQYELDSEDTDRVLGITKRHPNLALYVVHHDRKETGQDFVDSVSGTHGLTGGVDTTLVLRRGRHESKGTLDVTGRDVRESLIHLAYDENSPFWSVDPLGGLTDALLDAFQHIHDNGPLGATALGKALGITRQAAYESAERLVELGCVAKDAGKYRVLLKVSMRSRK